MSEFTIPENLVQIGGVGLLSMLVELKKEKNEQGAVDKTYSVACITTHGCR